MAPALVSDSLDHVGGTDPGVVAVPDPAPHLLPLGAVLTGHERMLCTDPQRGLGRRRGTCTEPQARYDWTRPWPLHNSVEHITFSEGTTGSLGHVL